MQYLILFDRDRKVNEVWKVKKYINSSIHKLWVYIW
jgi:hypothetical protein